MDEKILRVAHIVGEMTGGGVEAVVMNYYRHIDRSKVQFDFIVQQTSTHVPLEEIEKLGGRVFYVPHYKNLCKYRKALYKVLKENGYTVVHSHINTLSVFSLQVAKKAGVKIRIAHAHSTSNKKEWKRNLIKNMLKPFSKTYATHFFACSVYAGEWLFGKRAVKKGRVRVLNNAIELDKFAYSPEARSAMRAELGLDGKFVVGHVGRFVTQKNHAFLLDIFNEISRLDGDAVLLLVGDGPLQTEVGEKADALSLSDKVVFSGVHTDIEKYYQAMDVFVLPSLYEGLPVVGVEAQASGLHVVASDAMTAETKITPLLGFKPLSDGAEDWAKSVLLHKGAPRGESGKELAARGYDINTEAVKLADFYTETANGNG